MMVGTSPGKLATHIPRAIPLDTITYAIRASLAARDHHASGVFLALDKRLPATGCKKDAAAIHHRTERLRAIVRDYTKLQFVTESDLQGEMLDSIRHEYPLMMFHGTDHPEYWQRQTAIVLRSLGVSAQPGPHPPSLYKFGSIITRNVDGSPHGGEAQFDTYLPAEHNIVPIYAPPAYTLQGDWAVPYLLHTNHQQSRIVLPSDRNQLEREVNKLKHGISKITYDTYATTARVVLGEAPSTMLNHPTIISLPLAEKMTLPVHNSHDIHDLRGLLKAALTKLLPSER